MQTLILVRRNRGRWRFICPRLTLFGMVVAGVIATFRTYREFRSSPQEFFTPSGEQSVKEFVLTAWFEELVKRGGLKPALEVIMPNLPNGYLQRLYAIQRALKPTGVFLEENQVSFLLNNPKADLARRGVISLAAKAFRQIRKK